MSLCQLQLCGTKAMEHYSPCQIVNEPTSREDVPFVGLPGGFWMICAEHSDTMSKLAKKCARAIDKTGAVVLCEEAENISKAVLLADMMLERAPWLFKYVRTDSRSVEEHWQPNLPELAALKVVRERARIFIALTANPLNEENPPVQTVFDFLGMEAAPKIARSNRYYRGLPVNREESEGKDPAACAAGTEEARGVDGAKKPAIRHRRGVRNRHKGQDTLKGNESDGSMLNSNGSGKGGNMSIQAVSVSMRECGLGD